MQNGCCFNSIKVRLKPLSTSSFLGRGRLFQFHKGAIKTRYDFAIPEFDNLFQFHKGAIKTILMHFLSLTVFCFNSIKVRLKLSSFTFTSEQEKVSIP